MAGESGYFLQAFRRIGLVPDGGSTFLLARSLGKARAMELTLLGDKLPAAKALEWALANGLKSVQAGAQGEHKLARGYEPVQTWSMHYIADPGFRSAVEKFLDEERSAIQTEVEWLRTALPYRSSSSA